MMIPPSLHHVVMVLALLLLLVPSFHVDAVSHLRNRRRRILSRANSQSRVAPSNAFVLSDQNFQNIIGKDKAVLVDFYLNGCEHCEALKPEFERLAADLSALSSRLTVAAANGHEDTVNNLYGIKGYPTIMFFAPGSARAEKYDGANTAEALKEWLASKGFATPAAPTTATTNTPTGASPVTSAVQQQQQQQQQQPSTTAPAADRVSSSPTATATASLPTGTVSALPTQPIVPPVPLPSNPSPLEPPTSPPPPTPTEDDPTSASSVSTAVATATRERGSSRTARNMPPKPPQRQHSVLQPRDPQAEEGQEEYAVGEGDSLDEDTQSDELITEELREHAEDAEEAGEVAGRGEGADDNYAFLQGYSLVALPI